jgi:hypothetical protein
MVFCKTNVSISPCASLREHSDGRDPRFVRDKLRIRWKTTKRRCPSHCLCIQLTSKDGRVEVKPQNHMRHAIVLWCFWWQICVFLCFLVLETNLNKHVILAKFSLLWNKKFKKTKKVCYLAKCWIDRGVKCIKSMLWYLQ